MKTNNRFGYTKTVCDQCSNTILASGARFQGFSYDVVCKDFLEEFAEGLRELFKEEELK